MRIYSNILVFILLFSLLLGIASSYTNTSKLLISKKIEQTNETNPFETSDDNSSDDSDSEGQRYYSENSSIRWMDLTSSNYYYINQSLSNSWWLAEAVTPPPKSEV